jgi:hypothetical protein
MKTKPVRLHPEIALAWSSPEQAGVKNSVALYRLNSAIFHTTDKRFFSVSRHEGAGVSGRMKHPWFETTSGGSVRKFKCNRLQTMDDGNVLQVAIYRLEKFTKDVEDGSKAFVSVPAKPAKTSWWKKDSAAAAPKTDRKSKTTGK